MTEAQKLKIIEMAESCELFMCFADGHRTAVHVARFSLEAFRIAQAA